MNFFRLLTGNFQEFRLHGYSILRSFLYAFLLSRHGLVADSRFLLTPEQQDLLAAELALAYSVKLERKGDDFWCAEDVSIPYAIVYGRSPEEAIDRLEAMIDELAWRGSLSRGWEEVMSGKTMSVSEFWGKFEDDFKVEGIEFFRGLEIEQETDGRWIAEFVGLPGAMVYGDSANEAIVNLQALVHQTISAAKLADSIAD